MLKGNSIQDNLQGEQLNMAVFIWYLVNSDFSSEHVYSMCTRQGTRKTGLYLTYHTVA